MNALLRTFTPLGLAALVLAGCKEPAPSDSTASASASRIFMVTGIVERIVLNDRHAIIRHEKIPGYMAAMTMRFDVKDTNELSGLGPGDAIRFRYCVTENEEWIDQVTKFGTVQKTNAAGPKVIPRFVEEAGVGDLLPDLAFTNQHGAVSRLRDFRGREVALSFIYTRCTLSNLCSHVGAQFADWARLDTNTHLVCVTLDPVNDTPERLLAYMQRQGWNTNSTVFLVGSQEATTTLASACGVPAITTGGTILHNIRLIRLDREGRISNIVPGNSWTAATVLGKRLTLP